MVILKKAVFISLFLLLRVILKNAVFISLLLLLRGILKKADELCRKAMICVALIFLQFSSAFFWLPGGISES
jgi:hypothetical protein